MNLLIFIVFFKLLGMSIHLRLKIKILTIHIKKKINLMWLGGQQIKRQIYLKCIERMF